MRLPRDLSGRDLARSFESLGYRITRQSGSHIRLTTLDRGEHHVTIPNHEALRVGTLSAILSAVAAHVGPGGGPRALAVACDAAWAAPLTLTLSPADAWGEGIGLRSSRVIVVGAGLVPAPSRVIRPSVPNQACGAARTTPAAVA